MNSASIDPISSPETAEVAAVSSLAPSDQSHSSDRSHPTDPAAPEPAKVAKSIIGKPIIGKPIRSSIRHSLQASTWDGVFAAVYSNVTTGVLLTNFLIDLGANPTEIGLLAALPLVANLLQPIGAHWSEQATSRHWFCFWIYAPSRLLWLLLLVGIGLLDWGHLESHSLILWTLGIALVSHGYGSLGSASWLSWMARLVPAQLRGRYFSFRNGASTLIQLIAVPLTGLLVSRWPGGSLQGFGIVLGLALTLGMISLIFQGRMADVNPQETQTLAQGKTLAPGKDEAGKSEREPANLEGIQSETSESQPIDRPSPDAGVSVPEIAPVIEIVPVIEVESTQVAPVLTIPTRSTHVQSTNSWSDRNFLMTLFYFGFWMFSVNLSSPFFNVYLLENLRLDVSQVTLYTSLQAGANLLMLMTWGKLADRIGNRPVLLSVGVLVGLTPLLWMLTGANDWSIWVGVPLLHLLMGATLAAIDLCGNNLQISIAPLHRQSTYFATVAAVTGVCGAGGTLLGGILAQYWQAGGLIGLFGLSGLLRLMALLPLVFVAEPGSRSLRQLLRTLQGLKLYKA